MQRSITLLVLAMIFATGCFQRPQVSSMDNEVRRSLNQQDATNPAPAVTQRADSARTVVSQWRGSLAVTLTLAINEAEHELLLGAQTQDTTDMRFLKGLEVFDRAVEAITSASSEMTQKEVRHTLTLLQSSRELAQASNDDNPTATSPTNTLKALRKHQASDEQYSYEDK